MAALFGLVVMLLSSCAAAPSLANSSGSQSSSAAPPAGASPTEQLARVRHWLYFLDANLRPEIVEQMAGSAYDLVVIDYVPSHRDSADYPMAQVVQRLQRASHPKLVLAYVDIGQAESHRTYWQRGWRVGNPSWIVADDPDEWEGNFPVAFWREEWRRIWLDPDGYLQGIMDAGFDGVYLDWVEAYSDDNVRRVARRERVDPEAEMVRWVTDIAAFGRARRPGFLVVPQNAAELVARDDYAAVISAVAQEQTWFDGAADNDPPGDCPLPRTRADVDTSAYRRSLPRFCRDLYDNENSPLHTSTEEYLEYLSVARQRGLPVLTVDYAVRPDNVAWVYATARGLGFVPFVSSRHLDRYLPPVP